MSFVKLQASGNDFILFDMIHQGGAFRTNSRMAKLLCDRHFGVGADGVIELIPSLKNSVLCAVRIWNSDGSLAKMCGNGMRCIGLALHQKGLLKLNSSVTVDIEGRLVQLTAQGGLDNPFLVEFQVDLGTPSFNGDNLPSQIVLPWGSTLQIHDQKFIAHVLSLGNTHLVLMINSKDSPYHMALHYGAELSQDSRFSDGVNVSFVRIHSPNEVEVVVYERGAGLTLACGSGACASVIVAAMNQQVLFDQWIQVRLLGGMIRVKVSSVDQRTSILGTAHQIYQAQLKLEQ